MIKRKNRVKKHHRRLTSNKFRRILQIHKRKRLIKTRQRIGFMILRPEECGAI